MNAAEKYMKQYNIVWKFDGRMFKNGKKLNKHMTGYYAKLIKNLLPKSN